LNDGSVAGVNPIDIASTNENAADHTRLQMTAG